MSLRNPRSRYSFINYLFENGRLIEHLNLPMEFPLRKEYAQYVSWVAATSADWSTTACTVTGIAFDRDAEDGPLYTVTTTAGDLPGPRRS